MCAECSWAVWLIACLDYFSYPNFDKINFDLYSLTCSINYAKPSSPFLSSIYNLGSKADWKEFSVDPGSAGF